RLIRDGARIFGNSSLATVTPMTTPVGGLALSPGPVLRRCPFGLRRATLDPLAGRFRHRFPRHEAQALAPVLAHREFCSRFDVDDAAGSATGPVQYRNRSADALGQERPGQIALGVL